MTILEVKNKFCSQARMPTTYGSPAAGGKAAESASAPKEARKIAGKARSSVGFRCAAPPAGPAASLGVSAAR